MNDQDYKNLVAETWQKTEDAKNKNATHGASDSEAIYKDALKNNMDQLSPDQIKSFYNDLGKYGRVRVAENKLDNFKAGVNDVFGAVKDGVISVKGKVEGGIENIKGNIQDNKKFFDGLCDKVKAEEKNGTAHEEAVSKVLTEYFGKNDVPPFMYTKLEGAYKGKAVEDALAKASDKVVSRFKTGRDFACGAVSKGWNNLKLKYEASKLKAAFAKVGGAFKDLPKMTRNAVLGGLAFVADKSAGFAKKAADFGANMAATLSAAKNGRNG